MDVLSLPLSHYFHVFCWDKKYFLFDVSTHSLFQTEKGILAEYQQGVWTPALLNILQEGRDQGFFLENTIEISNIQDRRSFKSLCFMLTRRCNFRCEYCFENQQPLGSSCHSMEPLTARKALDWLVNNSSSRQQLEVDFFGGEPLLLFPVIRETVLYARSLEQKHQKKFMFSLTTNASLLDQDIISFLRDQHISVILSLDGSEDTNDRFRKDHKGKGTFQQCMLGISSLIPFIETGYYLRGTYTHQSLYFSDEVRYLYRQGIKQISFEPVATDIPGVAIEEKDLEIIRQEYHQLALWMLHQNKCDPELKFYHFELDLSQSLCLEKLYSGCGAGVEYLAVSPDGTLYPCHQMDGRSEFAMGTIHDCSVNKKLSRLFSEKTWLFSRVECLKCWARTLCGGGCLANNFLREGSLDKPYEMGCKIQKLRLEAALYYQSKKQ